VTHKCSDKKLQTYNHGVPYEYTVDGVLHNTNSGYKYILKKLTK